MKAVVLLFTKKDTGDSDEFVFPNLTRVNVTVEGNPNDIYSEGLAKRDMYREVVRFFTNTECKKYLGTNSVSRRKYYTDKFACVRKILHVAIICCRVMSNLMTSLYIFWR